MAESESVMDKAITSVITALVAVVLIASAFIPTAISQIKGLLTNTTVVGDTTIGAEASQYGSLLYLIITVTILAVVIGVVRAYLTKGGR